jgi:selenide,water dikinase
VFAVRQGPHVASNLRLALAGHEPRPVRLQRRALALIATADGCAIASRGPWFARGHWLWRLKDRIDRRFMTKYRDLPAMPVAPIPLDAMRCGGCGAKIGAQMLSEALAELQPTQRPDVVLGLAERDDAAAVTVPPGKVAVHSVDHFRAFVDDPYLFGRIAANHALGDLFAMNAEPQTALAICTLPFGPERRTVATLKDMLVGALSVFDAHGASLVGGHTSEGAELALGFAVNGLADPARLTRKSGLRPGDRLILAKPLGTGALLAANMRGKCNGRWLDGALVSMQLSSRDAARIFAAHGARATTDVTGFGLAGHLAEMLRASGVRAALDLDAIPILDGAAETMAAGIFSTLQQQNAQAVATDLHAPGSRQAILFDPQTAGGLLAGVPEADAAACLAALREIYPQAAIIGAVLPAGGGALIEVD